MQFQAGDVVELKSGGPQMTITRLTDDKQRAVCEWFNQNMATYDHKSQIFELVVLKKLR